MKLSLLIPVLNEEENIGPLIAAIDADLATALDLELEFVFVDDGSTDGTFATLTEVAKHDTRFKALRLSRNFGSHPALLAAFTHCTGDAACYVAADLQDPPKVLLDLLEKWRAGTPVVWGQRIQRDDEPLTQRLFAQLYYQLMQRYALKRYPLGGLDTCLVDRRVIDAVVSMHEKNTSIFGLILWSGFPQTIVRYARNPRLRGRSGWTLSKKIKLVVDSFIAFSFSPIRLVTYLGIIFSVLGFGYGAITMVRAALGLTEVEGWASLITVILFLSGIQLLMLGVVAEYLWRTLDETRGRPPFIVYQTLNLAAAQPKANL